MKTGRGRPGEYQARIMTVRAMVGESLLLLLLLLLLLCVTIIIITSTNNPEVVGLLLLLLPTTYYLLPTTYYLLPTTYYLLPTTYYLLPTTYYYYYLLLLLLGRRARQPGSQVRGQLRELPEYGWKPHRDFLAQQKHITSLNLLHTCEQQRGPVSSNSRFQTALF